jgi:hypothetical protein
MHRIALIIAALFSAGAIAEVGDAGGAYGGGTAPGTGKVDFQEADSNRDGVLSFEEARAAGIERFEEADRNNDGRLDAAEFSVLEEMEKQRRSQDME